MIYIEVNQATAGIWIQTSCANDCNTIRVAIIIQLSHKLIDVC